MPISAPEVVKAVALLTQDVVSTLGPAYAAVVTASATNIREFVDHDYEYFIQRVAEEVQQEFHDCFIDTTWPACPRHPNHPLWFHDGSWCCEQDGVAIARLGELR